MQSKQKVDGASLVRFIAAMMVVMFHVALMPKLAMPDELIFITQVGGFGVPLFYMLSAFLLSYGYHGQLETGDQVRQFYRRRFWRIAPLFYVMMAYYCVYLTFLKHSPPNLSSIITSATFTFNLLPQHVTGFVFASWSIGVEMLFYAVFPMALLVVSSLTRAVAAFLLSVLMVHLWTDAFAASSGKMASFGYFSLMAHVHYFAGGILTFFIWRELAWTPRLHRTLTGTALAALVGLVLGFDYLISFGTPFLTTIWAAAFALLILGLSVERVRFPLRAAAYLGEASYSLYLLHPAIIALMMEAGLYERIYAALPGAGMGYAGCVAVTLVILFPASLLTYQHIEKRFYAGPGMRVQGTKHTPATVPASNNASGPGATFQETRY